MTFVETGMMFVERQNRQLCKQRWLSG